MSPSGDQPPLHLRLIRHPLARVVAYYIVLAAGLWALRRFAPQVLAVLNQGEAIHGGPVRDPGLLTEPTSPAGSAAPGPMGLGEVSLISMMATSALMLPVIWVYQLTRRRRGYQQSLVQTLLVLPIVVAAAVALVRSSIALAFALGGIVGAVAFRHRLQDTKDAVYIFLAIAVGLAAGVQVFSVALALSGFFNLAVLALWYSDFGRVPAPLAGTVGRRRVELARTLAADRGKEGEEFVAVVDEQILQSMTPDQLAALAQRALSRHQEVAGALDDRVDLPTEATLVVVLASGASEEGLRRSVEQVLSRESKDWRLDTAGRDQDGVQLRYRVQLRKSVPRPLLLEAVRRATLGQAERVAIE
jgi:hypothetical protein